MIERMKKVSLVVQSKDKELALRQLAYAQVLHISEVEGYGEELSRLVSDRNHLASLLEQLPKVKNKLSGSGMKVSDIIHDITHILSGIKENEDTIIQLNRELERTVAWGSFDRKDVLWLAEQGYALQLYQVPSKQYAEWKATVELPFIQVFSRKGLVYVIAVRHETDKEFVSQFAYEMPMDGMSNLRAKVQACQQRVVEFNTKLLQMAGYKDLLQEHLDELNQKVEFETVFSGMAQDDDLATLQGYLPKSHWKSFGELARQHAWAVLYQDIADDDEAVPTKLKHYGVGAMVKPLLNMLDLVPGYREFDITFVMFFFFSVFFAMIIGDAGYGSIFSVVAGVMIISKLATGKKVGLGTIYFLILSLATVVWGALTGVWFGYDGFKEIPQLKSWMSEWLTKSDQNVMQLCFWIGTAHLLLAHGWSAFGAIQRKNPLFALAHVGHALMIYNLQFLVYNLILERPLANENMVMGIAIGYGMVILFGQQQRGANPIKQALIGIANFFPTTLSCVSNFSDIISYIRLYAVGLAGLSISQAFNSMALGMTSSPLLALIGAPLLLLVAHVVNIMLSLLSVVVHGVRLNSLEFSSHLGLEWSGINYRPFGYKKQD
jgi:V/A-type H+-transporting ATPase subunit I